MPFLLPYLFKLSLTLAVLYSFYYVLLKKLTFYTWNRFYLLSYSLLSFIIPFINITPWIANKPVAAGSLINKVSFIGRLHVAYAPPSNPHTGLFSSYNVVVIVFVCGMAIMLTRLLLQFISIQSIKRKAILVQTNNIRLYDVDGPISPFSFARSIFVNTRRHSEEDLQKIIQHEFVHIKQRHTADLLIGELLCIINWYNPFAWLIRKAIRQNLEFAADNNVLQTGVDATRYQYLLLKVTGLPHYSVSAHFNISSLKKRIFMMNKLQSARVHLLKFLFVLPLLAVMLVAFREQQVKKQGPGRLQNGYHSAYDTVPKPLAVTGVVFDTLQVKQTAGTGANGQDLLYVVDGNVLAGPAALSMLDNQWIEHVDDLEGKKAIDLYGEKAANGVLLITTAGNKAKAVINEGEKKLMALFNRALIIINGEEVTKSAVLRRLSHPPKSISIYTSDKPVEKYGDKGKNGVIILTLDQ